MLTSEWFEAVFLRVLDAQGVYLKVDAAKAVSVFIAVQPAVVDVLKTAEAVLLGGQHPGLCINHEGQPAIEYDDWEVCVIHMATTRKREQGLALALSALEARIRNEEEKAEMDGQS